MLVGNTDGVKTAHVCVHPPQSCTAHIRRGVSARDVHTQIAPMATAAEQSPPPSLQSLAAVSAGGPPIILVNS